MSSAADNNQQQRQVKHSMGKRTYLIWSKIKSEWLLMKWTWTGKPFVWYRLKNWGWEKFVPRWCPGISQSNSGMRGWAQFLTSKWIKVMPQSPSSPDLASCDLFLFQKVKLTVNEHHFESTENIQRSVKQALNYIPQNAFQDCYKEWQHCWKGCVQVQGMYFEGDHILIDE